MSFLLLIISIVLGAFGQIFFKVGVNDIEFKGSVSFYTEIATNLWVYAGFVCYGLSFFVWMLVLKFYEVSFARPFTSIGYIITFIFAVIFLGETFTVKKMMGIILIVIGVMLLK